MNTGTEAVIAACDDDCIFVTVASAHGSSHHFQTEWPDGRLHFFPLDHKQENISSSRAFRLVPLSPFLKCRAW
jgi:hypothetical protein